MVVWVMQVTDSENNLKHMSTLNMNISNNSCNVTCQSNLDLHFTKYSSDIFQVWWAGP